MILEVEINEATLAQAKEDGYTHMAIDGDGYIAFYRHEPELDERSNWYSKSTHETLNGVATPKVWEL